MIYKFLPEYDIGQRVRLTKGIKVTSIPRADIVRFRAGTEAVISGLENNYYTLKIRDDTIYSVPEDCIQYSYQYS